MILSLIWQESIMDLETNAKFERKTKMHNFCALGTNG